MAVKIKLKRLGKIRAPYYRIVVADARTKRDGRAIEEIGKYHPKAEPSFIEVDSERAQHWLSVGAQPTDPVRKLLEITGDWQKYKGLPGAEGTLRVAEPKADRKVAFAAALQETLDDSGATTKPKSRAKSGDSAPKTARAGKAEASGKGETSGKAEASGKGETSGKAEASGKGETFGKAEKSGQSEKAEPAAKPAKATATAAAEASAEPAAAQDAPQAAEDGGADSAPSEG